jgi:hypothetical protein
MKHLTETRVQRIIEQVILGDSQGYDYLDDDYQYMLDLGLLRQEDHQIVPSNPIYSEVIIPALNSQSHTLWREKLSRRQATVSQIFGLVGLL